MASSHLHRISDGSLAANRVWGQSEVIQHEDSVVNLNTDEEKSTLFRRLFTLSLHDEGFSRDEVVLNPSINGIAPTGRLLRLMPLKGKGTHHYGNVKEEDVSRDKQYIFLSKPFNRDLLSKQPDLQVSVLRSIAWDFDLEKGMQVLVRTADEASCSASHVEIVFRDQYLARADMWRLISAELARTCIFKGQKVFFMGTIKATIKSIFVNGKKATSAYFNSSTKPIFRSESARYVLFIQMSKEMWDFDAEGSGELMFDKVISGFLPELFRRWQELRVRHLVSIVLFTRMIYEERRYANLADPNVELKKSYTSETDTKSTSKDFYRVVVSDMASGQWANILIQLKKEFLVFLRDISIQAPDAGDLVPPGTGLSSASIDTPSRIIAGHLSAATRGNVLEAINLASSQFSSDYIDRDLVRTGVSIVVISPSAGLFEVDYKLLVATTENLVDNGVGIDLVCLSRMPLHSVPLFKYQTPEHTPVDAAPASTSNTEKDEETPTGSLSADAGNGPLQGSLNSDEALNTEMDPSRRDRNGRWSYGIPHWVDISFWSSATDESSKQTAARKKLKNKSGFGAPQHKQFLPRVRMYELQMMGVMENAISDISIPQLSRTFRYQSTFGSRPNTTNKRSPMTSSMHTVYGSFRSSRTDSPSNTPKVSNSPLSSHFTKKKAAGPVFEWMDEYDDLVFRHPGDSGKRTGKTRSSNQTKNQMTGNYSPSLLSVSTGTRHVFSSHMKNSAERESFLSPAMLERHASQKKPSAIGGGLASRTSSKQVTGRKMSLTQRQVTLGPRGFGAHTAKSVASTEVSMGVGAASLSRGPKPPLLVKDTGLPGSKSIETELIKKYGSSSSQQASVKTEDAGLISESKSPQSSRPIPIKRGTEIRVPSEGRIAQQPHARDHHEHNAGVELHARLAALQDVREVHQDTLTSETEDVDDAQPLQAHLSPSTTLAPWLTILNPSNPSKTKAPLASRLGRWHHLFPRPLRASQIKWKSLCSPAAIPLTTEDFTPTDQVLEEYQENVYHVEVPEKRDLAETPRALIMELIAFRLSRGFQIVVGAKFAQSVKLASVFPQPFNVFEEQALTQHCNTTFLSRGSTIHQIRRLDEFKIEVKQLVRHNVTTARGEEAGTLLYKPSIRSMLTSNYETQEISIAPQRGNFDWKRLDSFIVGHERPKDEDYVKSLRPWCTRFVLIPVETPANAPRTLNMINQDDDEEIRLEGIRKLTQLWQRFRYVPPVERRFQAPLRNRKDTNPLDIMYQTRNPSAIVADELENVAECEFTGRPVQLLPESDLYQRSNFKVSALAETIQSEKGVRMLDRRWHFRLHYNCFIGFELTTWLLQNFRDVDTRDEAVELGNELMKDGMFKHVHQRHDFRDGNYFYQIADEYRTPRPESRGWFGRTRASVPSTPVFEDVVKEVPTISRSRGRSDSASSTESSHPNTPTGKKQKLGVALSKSLLYDVDHRKRSYRPELINLHYDRLHNPDNCYHIRVEWMNTTPKLIQDAVTSWATSVDRFGLRLVEVPIGEASSITSMHPFRAPHKVKLTHQPPAQQPQSYFENTSFVPRPKPQKHYYQKALLKRFEFVLDFEAAADFPSDVDVTYSWGKPDYRYPQYIHCSGGIIAQINEEGDFLLLANRLYNNRLGLPSYSTQERTRVENQPSDGEGHRGAGFFRSSPHRQNMGNLRGSPLAFPYTTPPVRATLGISNSTKNTTRGSSPSNNTSNPSSVSIAKPASASATPESITQAFESFCNDAKALENFYDEVLSKASTPGPNTPFLECKAPSRGPLTPSTEPEKLFIENNIPSLALPERLIGKRNSREISRESRERYEPGI